MSKMKFSIFVQKFLRSNESKGLDSAHRLILLVMSNYMDMEKGTCFKDWKEICFECGMKKTFYYKKLNDLINFNYLSKSIDYKGKIHYKLNDIFYPQKIIQ